MSANKEVIERIRKEFLSLASSDGNKFHPADVAKVKENDWPIERFVLVKKDESSALKALVKAMEWRNTYGVNEMTDDYFPEEIYKIGLYHTNFKDKEGRPVIWTRISRFHKSDLVPLFKRFVVYLIEKLDGQTSHEGWAIVCDTTGAGLSNVDLDFTNFLTEVVQNYYPRGTKYNAVVDLPWILNAVAKVITSFMNEEMKNMTKYIKKAELTQYLDLATIPVHLKGFNDKEILTIPEGVKPLEGLTHTKFSAEQIKKIRSAFKAELK